MELNENKALDSDFNPTVRKFAYYFTWAYPSDNNFVSNSNVLQNFDIVSVS